MALRMAGGLYDIGSRRQFGVRESMGLRSQHLGDRACVAFTVSSGHALLRPRTHAEGACWVSRGLASWAMLLSTSACFVFAILEQAPRGSSRIGLPDSCSIWMRKLVSENKFAHEKHMTRVGRASCWGVTGFGASDSRDRALGWWWSSMVISQRLGKRPPSYMGKSYSFRRHRRARSSAHCLAHPVRG